MNWISVMQFHFSTWLQFLIWGKNISLTRQQFKKYPTNVDWKKYDFWFELADIALSLEEIQTQTSINQLNLNLFLFLGCNAQKREQEDPCKTKARLVGDANYCDRYWECGPENQPELYDCPNGLVFAGKHRGVTEGCDYPWRSNYCEGKQLASKLNHSKHFNQNMKRWLKVMHIRRWGGSNRPLWLVVRNLWAWNILYTLLDLLEWNSHWTALHWRSPL